MGAYIQPSATECKTRAQLMLRRRHNMETDSAHAECMLNKPNQQHIAKHFLDNNQILQKQRALFHSVAVPLVFFFVTYSCLFIMSVCCITRKVYGNETHQHLTKTFHFFYIQLLTAVGPHAEASASSRRAPRPLADIPPRAKCS